MFSWEYMDVPSAKPIHFLHISKTGGTALKYALRPHAEALGLQLHDHTVTLHDIPTGENVVFFVRKPIERFVSGYLSRQRQGLPRYAQPWSDAERAAFKLFPTANALAEALGSPDLALMKAAMEATRVIPQLDRPLRLWLESEDYLRSRLDDILLLGLHERLDNDFTRLRILLGLPGSAVLPKDDFAAHRAPANADRCLTPLAAANILAWYVGDGKLFEACRSIALTTDHLA